MRANRRDANESEIVALWKSIGAAWIPMQPGQGFDGLLLYRGQLHLVEIKGAHGKLTICEQLMQRECERCSIKYNIICTVDDAQRMVEEQL
jgi:hypothetical protein